jgi:hypothetical protein
MPQADQKTQGDADQKTQGDGADQKTKSFGYSLGSEPNNEFGHELPCSTSVFTAVGPLGVRRVQIIVVHEKSFSDVVTQFDFWALCAAYDGAQLHATVGARYSWHVHKKNPEDMQEVATRTALARGYRIRARRLVGMMRKGFTLSEAQQKHLSSTRGFGWPVSRQVLNDVEYCFPVLVKGVSETMQDALFYRSFGLARVPRHATDRFARVNIKHFQVNSYVPDEPLVFVHENISDVTEKYARQCVVADKPETKSNGRLTHVVYKIASPGALQFENVKLEVFAVNAQHHFPCLVFMEEWMSRRYMTVLQKDVRDHILKQCEYTAGGTHDFRRAIHQLEGPTAELYAYMPFCKFFCDGLPTEIRRDPEQRQPTTILRARILMRPGHFSYDRQVDRTSDMSWPMAFKWYITHVYFHTQNQSSDTVNRLQPDDSASVLETSPAQKSQKEKNADQDEGWMSTVQDVCTVEPSDETPDL